MAEKTKQVSLNIDETKVFLKHIINIFNIILNLIIKV